MAKVKVRCIHCGKEVNEFESQCPYCGKPTANRHAPTNVGDEPWKWKRDSQAKKTPVWAIIAVTALILIGAAIFFFTRG